MKRNLKINRYFNKKGNSYSTRDEQECLAIICKKLKIEPNPKLDDNYCNNIQKYLTVEKQVKEQYNCNQREIIFSIDI